MNILKIETIITLEEIILTGLYNALIDPNKISKEAFFGLISKTIIDEYAEDAYVGITITIPAEQSLTNRITKFKFDTSGKHNGTIYISPYTVTLLDTQYYIETMFDYKIIKYYNLYVDSDKLTEGDFLQAVEQQTRSAYRDGYDRTDITIPSTKAKGEQEVSLDIHMNHNYGRLGIDIVDYVVY